MAQGTWQRAREPYFGPDHCATAQGRLHWRREADIALGKVASPWIRFCRDGYAYIVSATPQPPPFRLVTPSGLPVKQALPYSTGAAAARHLPTEASAWASKPRLADLWANLVQSLRTSPRSAPELPDDVALSVLVPGRTPGVVRRSAQGSRAMGIFSISSRGAFSARDVPRRESQGEIAELSPVEDVGVRGGYGLI